MSSSRFVARAVGLLASHALLAQGAAAADVLADEILVTATRFPYAAFAAPIGARVIAAEQIAASGASNVAEALNKLGGVHLRQDLAGGSNPSLDLRGFGFTGDQNTLVLVDGVRISENELIPARLSGIAIDTVERIEILSSGGAVLYGANATGGVINVITRRARSGAREARLFAGAGNFGTHDLRGAVNVGGETVGLHLNAQDYRSDNERRNNRVERQNGGATLAFRLPDTDLSLTVGSERQRARLPGARTAAEWRSDPRGTSTPDNFADTDLWHAGLAVSHRLGDIEFAANLSRRDRSGESHYDWGGATFSDEHRRVTSDEFSPRVRWLGEVVGMPNELVAGYDWRQWDFRSRMMDDFGFGFAGPSLETGDQRTDGWYLQDTLRVATSTFLSVGARTEALRIRRQVPFALAITTVDQEDRRRLDAWSLGLKQKFGGGLAAHLRTGTSYRIANIDENRCYTATCTLLKPQTSRDHEAGLAWAGVNAAASVVVFRSDLENELYFNRLAGAFGSNVNMPPTRREGIELAGSWRPLAVLALEARYTVVRATFREGVFSGIDVSGKTVPVVPRHRASLLATWSVSDRDRLHVGINYVGRQRYDNDPANRFARIPDYTTVDAKYSRRFGDATVSLAINNLFDEKYYSYALVNSPTNPTTYNVYPDRSRTVMASLEYTFR